MPVRQTSKLHTHYKRGKLSADHIIGYLDPESDGSLEDDLAARRYRALLPEDDYDSDDY